MRNSFHTALLLNSGLYHKKIHLGSEEEVEEEEEHTNLSITVRTSTTIASNNNY